MSSTLSKSYKKSFSHVFLKFLSAITLEQPFHRTTLDGRSQQYLEGNNDLPFF